MERRSAIVLARLHARSLASSRVLAYIHEARLVCGTSKVHVLVDHGSGNSRLLAVVLACMNVVISGRPLLPGSS